MNVDNVLFYSKKCKYCSQIVDLINKADEIDNYKLEETIFL